MSLKIATFAQRPDLHQAIWSDEFRQNWAAFVDGGVITDLYYDSFFLPKEKIPFLEYGLVAFDSSAPDQPLARGFCVPFAFGGHRQELPDSGWDGVVRWADWDWKSGTTPNALSAIEINVLPNQQGRGLSSLMLQAMRDHAKRLGFQDLYAPVRPTHKHLEPHTPMLEYAFRIREDGLPFDPWLRVHARAGASIVKVAPNSMTMSGTLEQWREWTGLPFDQSGEVVVPQALVPVLCSVQHNVAAYVEPNVWMHHRM